MWFEPACCEALVLPPPSGCKDKFNYIEENEKEAIYLSQLV